MVLHDAAVWFKMMCSNQDYKARWLTLVQHTSECCRAGFPACMRSVSPWYVLFQRFTILALASSHVRQADLEPSIRNDRLLRMDRHLPSAGLFLTSVHLGKMNALTKASTQYCRAEFIVIPELGWVSFVSLALLEFACLNTCYFAPSSCRQHSFCAPNHWRGPM